MQLLAILEALLQVLPHLCPLLVDPLHVPLDRLNLGVFNLLEVVPADLLVDLYQAFLAIPDLLDKFSICITFALETLQKAVLVSFDLGLQVVEALVTTFETSPIFAIWRWRPPQGGF